MPERLTPEFSPEYCSCGAKLAENARFCHLCGRPVFPTVEPEASEETPAFRSPASLPIPTVVRPVGLRNPVALRVAFLMSLGMMLSFMLISLAAVALQMIGAADVLCLTSALGAGWFGAALYSRITKGGLTVASGARLGWIAGLITALILAALVGAAMLIAGDQVMQQFSQNPQFAESLKGQADIGASLALGFVAFFVLVSGICAAGGALGARFVGRNTANRV
jgi:hypothetical protein